MPPRKRQRLSPTSTSIPNTSPAATPISPSAASPTEPTRPTTTNYWSAAQQTALFKALIAHKPTGPHKHFHMVSIAKDMSQALGYFVPVEGVWLRLQELYDLSILDEKETAYAFGRQGEDGDWPASLQSDFTLPGVPKAHGPAGDEESDEDDAVNEEAIRATWAPQDEQEGWFIDQVWKRRMAGDDDQLDDRDELGDQDSPAPSTVASTGRRTRATKSARHSIRGASSTPMKDDDDGGEGEDEDGEDGAENEDGDEPGNTARGVRGTRSSARTAKKTKKR